MVHPSVLAMRRKRNRNDYDNIPMTTNKFSWSVICKWIGTAASALTIVTIIFGIGYWVAGIEHKVEIMNLNQKHNLEISNLRIQLNNQIQTIQNKYDILEAKYNSLKEEKEAHHEK